MPEEIEKSASEAYKAAFENAAANYEQMAKEAIAWVTGGWIGLCVDRWMDERMPSTAFGFLRM